MKLFKILIILFTLSIQSFSTNINRENTLVIAQEKDPRTFDPHFGNDGFSLRINRLIYSRLIEKDSNMKNIPGVAKSWNFISNQKIKFNIFNDIFFQNGENLTTKDIKFSFERMKNSPRISAILPPIKEIKIIDKYNFIMVLSKPFSPILDQLTHPALSIVSENYLKENPKILLTKPMGSGPYKLKYWNPDESILLEKFHSNHHSKINYENIKIYTIPLGTNRTIALETNEVDIAFSLPIQDEETINKNKNLKWLKKPSFSYTYMGINMKSKNMQDIKLRKAIDLAINKEELLNVVLNGEGQVANTPVAKGVFGYNSTIKKIPFNLNRSKGMIKHNLNLTLATMNNGIDIQIAELIQGYLKEIGINLKISILEPNVYWNKTNTGAYDMFIASWGSVTGDSDYALYPTHHSNAFGAPGNRTFFSNKEVDILLEKARSTLDKAERKDIYFKIQDIIVKNKSEIMLFYRDLNCGINKKVYNFYLYPIPIHNYSIGNF